MMESAPTDNQVLLVTGASKGIGAYLAEYYAEKGYHVVGCSRRAAGLKIDNYRHFCLDIADEKSVKQMFSEITKEHGRLDVLINNAGSAENNPILLLPPSR